MPADLVAAVTARHGFTWSARTTPAWRGYTHAVAVLTDEVSGRGYVLRTPAGADPPTLDLAAQSWIQERAASVGVPVPLVLAHGEIDGVSYQVQELVPGLSGATRSRSEREPELWSTLGGYAARIATIDLADAPAQLFTRFGRDAVAAHRADLAYQRAALTADDPLIALGVYRPLDLPALLALLDRLDDLEPATGLVHGDLGPHNLLLPDGERPVLLDWDAARVGLAGYEDLLAPGDVNGRPLLAHRSGEEVRALEDAFAAGFTVAGGQRLDRGLLADLRVRSAIDLVRWAVDRAPERLDRQVRFARAAVASLRVR